MTALPVAAGLTADDALDLRLAHRCGLDEFGDGDGLAADCFADEVVACGLVLSRAAVALVGALDCCFHLRCEVVGHVAECGMGKLPNPTGTPRDYPLTLLPMGCTLREHPNRSIRVGRRPAAKQEPPDPAPTDPHDHEGAGT